MADNTASINVGAQSVLRILERAKRLEQAITRAEGEKKVALETELATLNAQVAEIKAALNADPQPAQG